MCRRTEKTEIRLKLESFTFNMHVLTNDRLYSCYYTICLNRVSTIYCAVHSYTSLFLDKNKA